MSLRWLLRCFGFGSGAIGVGWIAPSRAKSWSPVARMDGETRHGADDGGSASGMVLGVASTRDRRTVFPADGGTA